VVATALPFSGGGELFVDKAQRMLGWIAVTSVLLLTSLLTTGAGMAPRIDQTYNESTGDIVWEVPGDEKILALTFDDGPDPKETPLILDVLKQYHVSATFFTIGKKVRQYPEIAKRAVAEGHEVANHTYNHRHLGRLEDWQIQQEIMETQAAILDVTGRRARLFRPPAGVYNSKVIDAIKRERLRMVMWSWRMDGKDWSKPGVDKIVRKVLRNTYNGHIILLHDSVSGKSQTIDALKLILPELIKRGYHLVTVSDLIWHAQVVR
jgi:peptidoglycan/xylan/chitin deacetylase (PgdA/CDA1 family)